MDILINNPYCQTISVLNTDLVIINILHIHFVNVRLSELLKFPLVYVTATGRKGIDSITIEYGVRVQAGFKIGYSREGRVGYSQL